MTGIIIGLTLFFVGLIFGQINEKAHFARLKKDEAEFADIKAYNLKTLPGHLSPNAVLVSGNVVIAVDYFKKFVTGIKQIFGGRLGSYETLVERARREAIIRMKKEARAVGANAVYNVRLEFSDAGKQPGDLFGGVELFAYGTAVKHHD